MSSLRILAATIALALSVSACGPAQAGCEGKLGVSRAVSLPTVLPDRPLKGRDFGLADREVILTYDDGPSSRSTPGVLDALEAECVKATFFMLGKNAAQNGEMAKRVLAEGHSVGSHTFTHPRLKTLSPNEAKAEVERGNDALRGTLLGSYQPTLFRFPYLGHSAELIQMTRSAGLVAIGVDISGDDFSGNACAVSVAKIMSQLDEAGRGIILMHDVMKNTPCETKTLLAALKLRNFRVVHLTM